MDAGACSSLLIAHLPSIASPSAQSFPCRRTRIAHSPSASPSLRVRCVGWDPEGVLGPPQGGHIARRSFEKTLQQDERARRAFENQVRQEREKRRAIREARIVPEANADLVNFFLDTEAQDIEYEIARCRPRLNSEFFSCLQAEMGSLRFALNQTKEMEDRLVELEQLNRVLQEGMEAYDNLSKDLIGARDRLARLLASEDKRATLLDMVEKNEVDSSLLALLDENIAAANSQGQTEAAIYMEKVRGAVIKYITL